MVELAPANGGTQSSLGNVYMMRGWPRLALERYSMANTLDPRDVSARLGQYDAYVELQRDDLARPIHDSLLERYPNQPSVQRMDRSWKAHRGWQLHAYAEGGRSSGGGGASPLGNDDGRYGVEVQSPVIDDRWRVVSFADRRSVDLPGADHPPAADRAGHTLPLRAAPTPKVFVNRANDHIGDTGLSGGFGWQFNDHWHAGVTAARNDADASLQARVSGITADSVAIAVDYRRNEFTHWSAGASQFRYDDGNRRDTLSTSIEQRLLTRPTLLLDGLGQCVRQPWQPR
jgi:biofilm PGA synthesis protein PgaA